MSFPVMISPRAATCKGIPSTLESLPRFCEFARWFCEIRTAVCPREGYSGHHCVTWRLDIGQTRHGPLDLGHGTVRHPPPGKSHPLRAHLRYLAKCRIPILNRSGSILN